MCYEESVIIETKDGTFLEGIYDGYGVVHVVDSVIEYIPSEFIEFVDGWYADRKRFLKEYVKFIDKIWCKSCKI